MSWKKFMLLIISHVKNLNQFSRLLNLFSITCYVNKAIQIVVAFISVNFSKSTTKICVKNFENLLRKSHLSSYFVEKQNKSKFYLVKPYFLQKHLNTLIISRVRLSAKKKRQEVSDNHNISKIIYQQCSKIY